MVNLLKNKLYLDQQVTSKNQSKIKETKMTRDYLELYDFSIVVNKNVYIVTGNVFESFSVIILITNKIVVILS